MKAITLHGSVYQLFTWNDFGKLELLLAKQINTSPYKFDRLIALAKGGTTISRAIADLCGIQELSSIQIEFYTGIETTARTPVITQSLPIKIKDERVLIVDDVADSGETLALATNYLNQHGASLIKSATLVTKSWTKPRPDFSCLDSDAWIIFPWETRETIAQLTKKWQTKGALPKQIHKNLLLLGYKEEEISIFQGL